MTTAVPRMRERGFDEFHGAPTADRVGDLERLLGEQFESDEARWGAGERGQGPGSGWEAGP
ncbi:hypothetical protein [Actinocorallia herbida]|nr:hypothetical protein [Actinocorallia herbida]